MRKFTASLLIAVTLWSSLIAPARAFVPLLFPYAAGSVVTSEGTIALAAVASTVGIGSIITMLAMTNDGNAPAANGSNSAIQIQLDPYTPLITPDSAKPIPVTPDSGEEVVSNQQSYYQFTDPVPGYTACQPVCHQFPTRSAMGNAAASADWGDGRTYTFNSGNTTPDPSVMTGDQSIYIWLDNNVGSSRGVYGIKVWGSCATGSTWNGSACVKPVAGCPPNYTLNAPDNMCYPNNPNEQQVADAKVQIERTLNEFHQNPNDPDPIPENLLVRPKDIVISTPERTTTVHINDDGTIDVMDITPTANGNTNVDNIRLSAPGPGQGPTVSSRSNQQYPGQESGPADPSATVNSPVVPGTGSGSPSSPAAGTSVLNLPANLAKTEKQCGYDADHKCTTDVKESVDKLVQEDSSLSGQKSAALSKVNSIETGADSFEGSANTTLSTLTSDPLNQHGITWEWLPELPSAQCSSVQYGAGTHVYTWDICPVVDKIRDILGYALYVITAISLVYIALGRKAE